MSIRDLYTKYAVGRLAGGWEIILFDEYGRELAISPFNSVEVEGDDIINITDINFEIKRSAIVAFFGIRHKGSEECESIGKLTTKRVESGDTACFRIGELKIRW